MSHLWLSRTIRIAAWSACALPLAAFQLDLGSSSSGRSAAATGNPGFVVAQANPSDHPMPPGVGPDGRPRRPFNREREEEWRETEQFLQAHAPDYLHKVESLTLTEPRLRQMHAAMVSRYQVLQKLKERFPELYEVRVKQLELFNALFATRQQYTVAAPADKEKLEAQLKSELNDLFDNSIQDRQTRINRLQEMLVKLQKNVEQDTKTQQQLVDAHYKKVIASGVDPTILDGFVKDDGSTDGVTPDRTERPFHTVHPTTKPQ